MSCTFDEGQLCTYHTSRRLQVDSHSVADAHGVGMSGQSPECEQKDEEGKKARVLRHVESWIWYGEAKQRGRCEGKEEVVRRKEKEGKKNMSDVTLQQPVRDSSLSHQRDLPGA